MTFFAICGVLQAQTKKPAPAKAAKTATAAPAVADTTPVIEPEPPIPHDFTVYSKKYKIKRPRIKLCISIPNGDSTFNHCFNDSLLKDPERSKLLFQQRDADSTYALVYAMAFTKDPLRPECNAGKETKLYFIRFSNSSNKGIVKFKYIESCNKTITRLSREPIEDWDGSAPLRISYNRGTSFHDVLFDPQNYKLGLQSPKDQDEGK